MGVSGQLHAPGKEPRYTLDRRLGGPQSLSGRCIVEKNLLALPGMGLPSSSPQSVPVPTELSRLPAPISPCPFILFLLPSMTRPAQLCIQGLKEVVVYSSQLRVAPRACMGYQDRRRQEGEAQRRKLMFEFSDVSKEIL
jgi:hypothetical protein